ncbi:MAG: hypothetical protein IPK02_16740 [Candidatus Accumulibacter sp.]|uniref:Deacetylase sirtuin-type domain-containing protein n=1 Tax=Candidatus Accumulibacter affinis TaxID=2954384 RepID=A0A935T9E4_9PROT|nr:hypothetical protein [Candidatus Accumulibacter affinis]
MAKPQGRLEHLPRQEMIMHAINLESIASMLRAARAIVVFSGAGLSADSGIPTFRDGATGMEQRRSRRSRQHRRISAQPAARLELAAAAKNPGR